MTLNQIFGSFADIRYRACAWVPRNYQVLTIRRLMNLPLMMQRPDGQATHLSMRQNPGCSLSFCMLTAGGIERPQKKAWLDLPAGSIGK